MDRGVHGVQRAVDVGNVGRVPGGTQLQISQ